MEKKSEDKWKKSRRKQASLEEEVLSLAGPHMVYLPVSNPSVGGSINPSPDLCPFLIGYTTVAVFPYL